MVWRWDLFDPERGFAFAEELEATLTPAQQARRALELAPPPPVPDP